MVCSLGRLSACSLDTNAVVASLLQTLGTDLYRQTDRSTPPVYYNTSLLYNWCHSEQQHSINIQILYAVFCCTRAVPSTVYMADEHYTLLVPPVKFSTVGDWALPVAAPMSMSHPEIMSTQSSSIFPRNLETFRFSKTMSPPHHQVWHAILSVSNYALLVVVLLIRSLNSSTPASAVSTTLSFLARDSMLRAICYRPSVCPSVCPSHGWISRKRLKLGSCNFHHTLPHPSSFCRISFIQKFEGDPPEWERQTRAGSLTSGMREMQ